ncbi:MAG: AAA family ATPase [Prevotella sp.]
MKHEITEKYVTGYNHFRNNLCGYHGITDFFKDDSYIRYESEDFVFVYENKHLTLIQKKHDSYKMPKIMYVPAERNMMVAIEHAEKVRRLPSNLQTMQNEYLKALKSLKGKVALPVKDVYLQYDRLNKVTWIMGEDYRVRAENSASGYQSMAPLVLVSDYLADMVRKQEGEPQSAEERDQLSMEIAKILESDNLQEAVKSAMIENINKRYTLNCFFNIVEEPEQNLYPLSQKSVLQALLIDKNKAEGNLLIMTTHSPYLLNYLSLAIKANNIATAYPDAADKLSHIVPQAAFVAGDGVNVYEIRDNGQVRELSKYGDMPSDENLLNIALEDCNDMYNELLDIEEECRHTN